MIRWKRSLRLGRSRGGLDWRSRLAGVQDALSMLQSPKCLGDQGLWCRGVCSLIFIALFFVREVMEAKPLLSLNERVVEVGAIVFSLGLRR